jgi:DNA-binding GntR family transcriptional regulator
MSDTIRQDTRRKEMASMLEAIAAQMLCDRASPGHVKDLQAVARAVRNGENSPSEKLVGYDSDFGSLVSGCVSRILRKEW